MLICGRALRRVSAPTVPWRVYKKNFKFSIVSYNVLSQKLLENNKYLYRGINERYLKSDRTYRIMDELDEYDADVRTQNLIRNRPNQEIMVPDWLKTSHVTKKRVLIGCLLVSVGQKTGGKKAYTIPPGLWCTEELGYHEHGLVARTDAELHICNDIYRSVCHHSLFRSAPPQGTYIPQGT
eukprot:sb/3471672/